MNKEESLALYAQGHAAWNAWAEDMLEKRQRLELDGDWSASPLDHGQSNRTRNWHSAATASFAQHVFEERTDFSGLTFPGYTNFENTSFQDYANFDNAVFQGPTIFEKSCFHSGASFDSARFNGRASFDHAKLQKRIWFERVNFQERASFDYTYFRDFTWFALAEFNGYTNFDDAQFEGECSFRAMVAHSAFSMASAKFLVVPDFIQTRFSEPPRLDNITIKSGGIRAVALSALKDRFRHGRVYNQLKLAKRSQRTYLQSFCIGPNDGAYWRWLRKLATQGHDHEREQEFFKRELLARRWRSEWPWHARFWFGWAYQVLSDFGRSLWLPLLWLGLSIGGFTALYLGQYMAVTGRTQSGLTALAERAGVLFSDAPPPIPTCALWPGDPVAAALGLSLRNAVLFAGAGLSDKLTQIHGCLWGGQSPEPLPYEAMPARFVPNIPDSVAFLGVAQSLISAVLIFLFLLAVRNHFRIK